MTRGLRGIVVGVGLALAAGGCQAVSSAPPATSPAAGSPAPEVALPPTVRGSAAPDLRLLPPFGHLEAVLTLERGQGRAYRNLNARDCQCLAANASRVANQLERKAALCDREGAGSGKGQDCQLALRHEVLHGYALEARNRAAGTALELYYRLAEAEARRDLLHRSFDELEAALERGAKLREQGIPLPTDFDRLRRLRTSTLGDEVELGLTTDGLNARLQHLLNLGPQDGSWQIWPDLDWTVADEAQVVPQAVAVGLTQRPELILLRRLVGSLDRDTVPVVRSVLGKADALLGMECAGGAHPMAKLFAGSHAGTDEEAEALAEQVRAYLVDREQEVAAEVRQAALTVAGRLRQVAVAQQQVRDWQVALADLDAQARRGIGTFPAATRTRLELLNARGALVAKVVAWQIARVKLAEAQGLLAESCCGPPGASPPAP